MSSRRLIWISLLIYWWCHGDGVFWKPVHANSEQCCVVMFSICHLLLFGLVPFPRWWVSPVHAAKLVWLHILVNFRLLSQLLLLCNITSNELYFLMLRKYFLFVLSHFPFFFYLKYTVFCLFNAHSIKSTKKKSCGMRLQRTCIACVIVVWWSLVCLSFLEEAKENLWEDSGDTPTEPMLLIGLVVPKSDEAQKNKSSKNSEPSKPARSLCIWHPSSQRRRLWACPPTQSMFAGSTMWAQWHFSIITTLINYDDTW